MWENLLDQISTQSIINIVGSVLILIVGWIVALIIAAMVRKGLHGLKLDERLAGWTKKEEEEGKPQKKPPKVISWISRIVFYTIMVFVLLGFFQNINLTNVSEPLNRFLNEVFTYLPTLIGGAILIFIAIMVANILKIVIRKLLVGAKIDDRLQEKTGKEKVVPLSQTISKAAYWVVILLFLPPILSALKLEGRFSPVQNMINKVLTFVPNILAAVLILLIGWYLAKILQKIVAALLATIGLDSLSDRIGLSDIMGEQKLSTLLGYLIYAVILIFTIIASLNTLNMEAISRPTSNMLNIILEALPTIFAAGLVLLISYFLGRLVKKIITKLLTGIGFDNVLAKLGISKETPEGKWSPAAIVGHLVLVVIMLFAAMEAAELLGFGMLSEIVVQILGFISNVVLGLIILGIGIYFANLVYGVIDSSEQGGSHFLARVARFAILILTASMALERMGLSEVIIMTAFVFLGGTIAISAILAFGLGGRDIAAEQLKEWKKNYQSKKEEE